MTDHAKTCLFNISNTTINLATKKMSLKITVRHSLQSLKDIYPAGNHLCLVSYYSHYGERAPNYFYPPASVWLHWFEWKKTQDGRP